jgi:hypothetical protein
VSTWRNQTEKGDTYEDGASGKWKETTNFSPTDLAVVSQLTSQAFPGVVVVSSTVLVDLSMLPFLMYERFQALGKGQQRAFVHGEVWRRYEKQILEFR